MFGGMCFCLPLALYLEKLDKAATAAENGGVNEPLLAAPGEVRWRSSAWASTHAWILHSPCAIPLTPFIHWRPLLQVARPPAEKNMFLANLPIAIPTFFDLVATVLMNVGLLYVTASVYQMMRGAEMLFAALFAVVFLKRRCPCVWSMMLGGHGVEGGHSPGCETIHRKRSRRGVMRHMACMLPRLVSA